MSGAKRILVEHAGSTGMERLLAIEEEKLKPGGGGLFEGNATLAVTKEILQAGVSPVGSCPGAPEPVDAEIREEAEIECKDAPADYSEKNLHCRSRGFCQIKDLLEFNSSLGSPTVFAKALTQPLE